MTNITVIIPVYNRAHTIARAVGSVVAQTGSGFAVHVLAVDDHSSDDLAAALRPYGDRVTVLRHGANHGAASARNTGIAAATGDYVAFLDSDDVWLPEKLAMQIAAMKAYNWKASCTAYYLARPGRTEIVSPHTPTGLLAFSDLIWGCVVSPGSTLVCNRTVFDEIGLFEATMRRLEDWDWLLRFTSRYPLGFLAQPLARIEPSRHPDFAASMTGIDAMRARHMAAITGPIRRHFAAALDFQRAGAHYRRGELIRAASMLVKSLVRVPLSNRALTAMLYNRLRRA